MKKCIVNLVSNNPALIAGQTRLRNSLPAWFDGDFIGFVGEETVGAPPHLKNPYAFKIYAIEEARNRGYDQVLWLDASVYAVQPVQPIFDRMNYLGLFMEEAGHYIGSWANDRCLQYFGISRDEAMAMTMYSAGFTGIDFTNSIACEFFAEWRESMLNGIFKGQWQNVHKTESNDPRCHGHRHDMTCGSIIANKQGLVKKGYYNTGGTYFAYIGAVYGQPKETAIFHLAGIR